MHKATNKFSLPQFYMVYVLLYVLYNINKHDVLQLTKKKRFSSSEFNRFFVNFSSCAQVYFHPFSPYYSYEKEFRKKRTYNLEQEYSLSYTMPMQTLFSHHYRFILYFLTIYIIHCVRILFRYIILLGGN